MLEFDDGSSLSGRASSGKVILTRSFASTGTGPWASLRETEPGKTTINQHDGGLEKPTKAAYRTCRVFLSAEVSWRESSRHTAAKNARYIGHGSMTSTPITWRRSAAGWPGSGIFRHAVGTYSQGMRARFTFSLMLALDFDIYLNRRRHAADHRYRVSTQGRRDVEGAVDQHHRIIVQPPGRGA